jgi:O-antigen/teichoic acid export membrane protein
VAEVGSSLVQRFLGPGPRALLARGASASFLLQSAGALLGFALQVALARWMSVRDYGSYAYVFAWASLLAVPISLGVPGVVLRFVAAYEAQGDPGRLRGVVRTGTLTVVCAGLAFGALGTAVVAALWAAGTLERSGPALVGVWLAPALAVALVQQEMSRGLRRILLAFTPLYVLRPLLTIAGAWTVLELTDAVSGTEALAVTLAVVVVLAAGQGIRIARLLRAAAGHVAPTVEPAVWARVALPLLLAALFSTALRQTDVLMVGTILGPDDTAFYNAAAKTAALVGFVLVATNAMAAPLFAGLYASGDRASLQRLATTVARWSFWPSVAIASGLAALSGPLLRVFGPDFSAARWPLVILVAGQLVNAATGSVGYLLVLTGHQKDAARVYGVFALVNVALVPLGIVLLGTAGAALATALATVGWNLWMHRLVVRRIGIEASIVTGERLRRIVGLGSPAR